MKEVAAAIIKKDGKMLICQRSADDECGLMWEFPGGKREKETMEQCVIREIKEELELDIIVEGVFCNFTYHFNGMDIYFTVFNTVIAGGDMKLNVHNAAKWITAEELHLYNFMLPDYEIINKLI